MRSSPILEYSPTALLILTFIGSTTAFVAATSGLVQNDLKRIVAFSTISQLGCALLFIIIIIFHILDYETTYYFPYSIVHSCFCSPFSVFNKNKLLVIKSRGTLINNLTNSFYYFSYYSVLPNRLNTALCVARLFTQGRGYSNTPSSAAEQSRNTAASCPSLTGCTPQAALLCRAEQMEEEEFNSGKSSSEINNALAKTSLNNNETKDRFYSLPTLSGHTIEANYIDKYIDFSYNGRKIIKQKYNNVQGIYLWVNNINNKSYVGKSVNLFNRLNKNYLSSNYIKKNKDKMAICAAIFKYDIKNFTFYILEVVSKDSTNTSFAGNPAKQGGEYLSQKENYWHSIINPTYNIQTIIKPFTGVNHYRFGKKVSESIRLKISKTLKGRVVSEEVRSNHITGARKKIVYCYDWDSGKFLMEFPGIRIMERAVNRNSSYIRHKLDKYKPFLCTIENVDYKMLLKSTKILNDSN